MKTKTITQELTTLKPGFGKWLLPSAQKLFILLLLAGSGLKASAQCTGNPVALFSNSAVCLSNTTQFTDLSTSSGTITSWSWDFGDGSAPSASQNPSHLYANSGHFNVALIVGTNTGCHDTLIKPIQVYSNPLTAFTHTIAACYVDSIYFMNTSTIDSTGSLASYLWIFGDGSPTSNLINTAHHYINGGTYNVTLVVTSNWGCSGTATEQVQVNAPPPIATATPSLQTFCSGGTSSIALSSSAPGTTYSWSVTQTNVSGASAGSGNVIAQTLTATGILPGTALYTIICNLNGCAGNPVYDTVNVNPSVNSSFNYSSGTYCQSGTAQTPVITGLPGGTFTSTPAGLSINPSTGAVNLATSVLGSYTVSYSVNGTCPGTSSIGLTITNSTPPSNFTYSGSPFSQSGNNPLPVFGAGASAGTFTAVPAGLVFTNVNTGEINLAASTPGTYMISNTIPTSGTCIWTSDSTTIVISACSAHTSLGQPYFNSPAGNCINDSAVIDFQILSYANLSPNDSSIVIINWGDGVTTSFSIPHSGRTDSTFSMPAIFHIYNTAGVYTSIITFFDSGACYNDSVIGTINVNSATCGNLTGTVYEDANNNCLQDNGEPGIAGIEVLVTQGGNTYGAWTDYLGNYGFNGIPAGTYSIQVNNINAGYTILCSNSLPHTGTITTGISVENFAVSCNGSFDVAVTGISLMDGFFPGTFDAVLPHVGLLNNACNLTIAGQVKMILDPCIQYTTGGNYSWFSNPPSAVIHASSGDTLVWNVSDINNIGSFSYWDYAVNISTCTSAQVGDSACITMMVLPTAGDVDLSNNTYTRCFAIGVSYDPNYKEVVPKGSGVQGFIPANTPELTYTINFQNTGTSAARNIYVIDSIDTDLNINSIEILSASHGLQVYELPNRAMKFMFANIMLPDSTHDRAHSHGYVTFRIKPNTGLSMGIQIKNRGHIYFDYNEPVATNTTLNTIAAPSGINEINKSGLLKVYPNPAKDVLVVSMSSNGSSAIVITDVLGKTVRQLKTNELQTEINISDLQDGIYFIKLTQYNASYVEKIIISK